MTGEKYKNTRHFFNVLKVAIVLLFVSLIITIKPIYADTKTEVYGGDILENADGSYMTSVFIKNNKGIMGYKIKLKYNEKELSVKTVTAGEAYRNGTFENNIGMKKGTCDVLWAGTKNVKKDGELFYLKFTKEKDFKNKAVIKLSYSKGDTFDEKYRNSQLECKDIEITNLDKLLANTNVKFENTEVKEAVDYTLTHGDAEKIIKAVEEVKKPGSHYNHDHDDLATIDKDSTTQNILAKLIEKGIDVSKIQTLDNDKQIDAVEKLYSKAKKEKDSDNGIQTLDNKTNVLPFLIGGSVLGCFIIGLLICIIVKKKKKDNNHE